jgi:hypothetical protein
MNIILISIRRELILGYKVSVEAFDIFHTRNIGDVPIGIAMFYGVGIASIIIIKVIEF